jgi:glycosyltransferase involved in cell wall biosynthesis
MRILFYSDNLYPEISGISDSILMLGEELAKRGHQVAFSGPSYSLKNYKKTATPKDGSKESRLNKFEVYRLPSIMLPFSITSQSRIVIPFGYSSRFIKKFVPDIIHTNSPFGAGLEALYISRKFQIPLIGTNHTPPEEFFPRIFKKYYSWYYSLCVFVSTPSYELLNSMKKSGYSGEIERIANPVILDRFFPVDENHKIRLKESLNIKGPVILYTGRLSPEKHVDTIIKAISELVPDFRDIRLIVTGHGSAKDDLVRMAEKLQVTENIIFTDYVSLDRLVELYQMSDIFSIMSTAETQSISLMQAFATGVPAICANSHGLVEYTDKSCGFLVEYNDSSKLSSIISDLLNNEVKRKAMGASGIKYVKQFSISLIANKWEELYNKYKI